MRNRAELLGRMVGDCFTFQGTMVLALDKPTHQLVQPLAAFCGIGAHRDRLLASSRKIAAAFGIEL